MSKPTPQSTQGLRGNGIKSPFPGIMKLLRLASLLGSFSVALADVCAYRITGSIVNDPILGWSWSGHLNDVVQIYPNPILCGQGSGNPNVNQDSEGKWIVGCQNGFSLTMSKTGTHVTFVNGALTDEWNTGASADEYDCYGACDDKKGACVKCTQYDFSSDGGCQNTDPADPPAPPPKQKGKLMVVGDSISHGMEADWTWRWRLSAWCK